MDSTIATPFTAPAPGGLVTDPQACYRALVSRDERFDGRFFVGVRTTRIYCRPVCRVRMPRAENCRFYVSAAAAEGAGFRPCLRCRPELAPGHSMIDAADRLAAEAARLIERDLADPLPLAGLADSLGVSDRHLRRVFEATYGVSPVAWRQTRRLLLAKRLLTDTDLPVIEVAGAAGFQSLRRFNASIRESYRLSPSELRGSARGPREAAPAGVDDQAMVFQCTWRAPYDWPWICQFLGARAIDGVEHVAQARYSRTLTLTGARGPISGWLSAAPGSRPNTLAISMSTTLAPRVAPALTLARTLFDLDADPDQFLPVLGELASARPGLRVPGAVDAFEIGVRAVLGQQISVKAARTIASRFVQRFGEPLPLPAGLGLSHCFPTPAVVAAQDPGEIAALGIIGRRARTIQQLAEAIASGGLDLRAGAPVTPALAALTRIAGIGDWTAQYIAMRALRWPDAFPAADLGVMKGLGVKSAAQATEASRGWRPWRAYAVMHLWARLGAADPADR